MVGGKQIGVTLVLKDGGFKAKIEACFIKFIKIGGVLPYEK